MEKLHAEVTVEGKLYHVSTVELGGFFKADPLFSFVGGLCDAFRGTQSGGFETMVFSDEAWRDGPLLDLYAEHYSSEALAREGHERIQKALQDGKISLNANREQTYARRA